ncbi:phage portal protein [Salinarimonas rosea]|uniref:phage portal protein n=1 Tax=Salinarimonas rosea TaxID=552063 RepID=UPI000407B2E4|nr:phage portal protein [Salinarimonas rosea]
MEKKHLLLDASGHPIMSDGRRLQLAAYGDTAWNAASFDRELRDWDPSRGSADADSLYELDDIRARGRDLRRNATSARGGINALVDYTIGTIPRFIPKPDWEVLGKDRKWANKWSRAVKRKFAAYARSRDVDATREHHLGGLSRLIMTSYLESGDAWALPMYQPDSGQTQYGSSVMLVESDRISNPMGQPDREDLRGGVHIDPETGEMLGVYVQKIHPGDVAVGLTGATSSLLEWEYVPAFTPWGRRRVIRLWDRDRIGANRGLSVLATAVPELRMLMKTKLSEVQAAYANSLISVIIKSNLPPEMVANMFDSPEAYLQFRATQQPKLASGAAIQLAPGEEASGFSPNRPNTALIDFMKALTREIFATIGVPYEIGMKDFAGLNYSNAKTIFADFWKTVHARRDHMANGFWDPVYELWFEEAVHLGEIPDCTADDLYESEAHYQAWTAGTWIGDGEAHIDPEKDAKAIQLRIATGTSTLERECARLGLDWQEVLEEQAAERELCEELGIPYPGDIQLPGAAAKLNSNDDERTRTDG